jgi:hypothetical protein
VSNHQVGNPPAGRLRRSSRSLTPKRKAIPIAIINLIHCRRVCRRNVLAKHCPPYVYLLLTKIPLNNY